MNQFIENRNVYSCHHTGHIFCADCGARLVTSTTGKQRVRKDGTIHDGRYWRYICYNRMRHKEKCNGQSNYSAIRVDEAVAEIVREILNHIKAVALPYALEKHFLKIHKLERKRAIANKELTKAIKTHDSLKLEVLSVLKGESAKTPDQLNKMIVIVEKELDNAQSTVDQLSELHQDFIILLNKFEQQHGQLVSWAETFDKGGPDAKKAINCKVVGNVFVKAGYEITVEFSPYLQRYQELTEAIMCL